jgi:putative transposase
MKQILTLTTRETQCLTDITRASTSPQRLVQRASIILGYARSGNQSAVAKEVRVDRDTVRFWLSRWRSVQADLEGLEALCQAEQLSAALYRRKIESLLCDASRPGAPPTFSEAQKQQIIALASQTPEQAGVPITHWSHGILAQTVATKGIAQSISPAQVGRFLKGGHLTATPKSILGTSQHR